MPNYCTNKIVANGSKKEISELLQLILSYDSDSNPYIDYEIVVPMPKVVEGISVQLGLITRENYEINKPYGNRIGLVKPNEFLNEAFLRGLIADSSFAELTELLESNPYFTQDKPIEECLQDAIRATPTNKYDEIVKRVLAVLSLDCTAKSQEEHGFISSHDWGLHHWGVATVDAETDLAWNEDEHIVIYFYTPQSSPNHWFTAVCKELDKLGSEMLVSMSYAQSNCWFGGCYERNGMAKTEEDKYSFYRFDDSEIAEFLDVEIETDA